MFDFVADSVVQRGRMVKSAWVIKKRFIKAISFWEVIADR